MWSGKTNPSIYAANRARPPDAPRPAPKSFESKELGAVVNFADEDLLARHMLLTGLKVEKLLPDGPKIGLKAGDVIPHYHSVYDVVMSSHLVKHVLSRTLHQAYRKKELIVFRDKKRLALPIQKP